MLVCADLCNHRVDLHWKWGKIISPCCRRVWLVSDCTPLSTARWLCASQTTTSATQSATLAQIAALTSGWEVTFGLEMWCTVRSTPIRGTKAQVLPPTPPCPLANEPAASHLPHSGQRVLLVCLKIHLIWLGYRLWEGRGGGHWSTIWHRMFFSDHI